MSVKSGFRCGIDTIEIMSRTFLQKRNRPKSFTRIRLVKTVGDTKYYGYRFNPMYLIGEEKYSLTPCIITLINIIEETNLENPVIIRVDYCFDDYSNYYNDLSKINHFLFFLIAKKYHFTNNFISYSMESPEGKSTYMEQRRFINGRRLEAEFYNKIIQEPTGTILCRLEFRSKPLYIKADDIDAFVYELRGWLRKAEYAANLKYKEINALLIRQNDKTIKLNSKNVEKRIHSKKDFGSTIQGFHRYIFTRRQLGDLLEKIGIGGYESRASKYLKSHIGVELFKPADLQEYVHYIVSAAELFLAS